MSLLVLGFLAAVIRISVPYALAALAGTVSEKSGVVQIALEGLLLTGAFAATVGADVSGSALGGIVSGALAGAALAAVYAVVVLWLAADQIVTGVAINLLADGLTRYLLKVRYDSASNSPRVDALSVPPLLHGGALVQAVTHPAVLGTVFTCLLIAFMLQRTVFGLRLRAVGEHPAAARTLGVDPRRVRLLALTLGGLLAGAGGAYLAVEQRQFVAGMSSGRGYIALAAMIFGRWRALPAVAACLLFGAAESLQIRLQTQGGLLPEWPLPEWALQMLPYLLTLLVLGGIGRARGSARRHEAPGALGRPLP